MKKALSLLFVSAMLTFGGTKLYAQEENAQPADATTEEVAAEEEAPADAVGQIPGEPAVDKTPAATGDELEVPQNEGEQKSAEELLSEFEKMLAELENKPVPERTCNIDDETCESCSG